MLDSTQTRNVIEATNKPHLFEKLEDLQKRFISCPFHYSVHIVMFSFLCSHMLSFNRLGLCEKALAEYLETKRLAFPRFYFISSADLFDILSKGSRPREVHLWRVSIHFYMLVFISCHHLVYLYLSLKFNDWLCFAGDCPPLKTV